MKSKNETQTEIFRILGDESQSKLIFIAPLTIENTQLYDSQLDCSVVCASTQSLVLDFSQVRQYDSYFVLLVQNFIRKTSEYGVSLDFTGMSEQMSNFLNAMVHKQEVDEEIKKKSRVVVEYFSYIGNSVIDSLRDVQRFIEFSGDLFIKFLLIFYKPSAIRWKDFAFHFTRSGVGAVPIVVLIVFLIGLISGYQGAVQLARFGADIFIADLVGIAITRELAPLMTAILVAGRSGSAFAAELGTMKVSEEIDALETMGFDSMTFHVIPRILSVVIAMPMLVLITDVAGIAGGLVAAIAILDVSFTAYVNQLQLAVSLNDITSGLIKSVIYGFLIATIGCFRGMQVRGGAESVGKYTTASVVTGVFLIILADAVFTFVFQAIGL